MFIRRLIPDLTFNGSTESSPSAVFSMKSRDFSGDNYTTDSDTVTRSATSPIEQYTNEIFLRERGRQMSLKVENTAKGVKWRLGTPRLEAQPDGRR